MSDWKEKAQAKKASVDALLPPEWKLPQDVIDQFNETTPVSVIGIHEQYMSDYEIEITEVESGTKLIEHIANKKYSAVDVVSAFLHRAAIANQLTNCCTEYMFDYGLQRAKYLDEFLLKNEHPIGPLHGLPISLKDSFNVPGFDSTLGYISFIGNKDNIPESKLCKILHDLGAVFYVKTNLPTTTMAAETENNIFGRTLNPLNLTWSPGGSSGGEGSLIKQRGSLLGIGTDIGGSVRIPALCCGIYGFRPSADRIPYGDKSLPFDENYLLFKSVAGPLATNIDDIILFTQSVLNAKPWLYDHSALPFTYQKIDPIPSKLTIGVIVDDETLPVHPPIQDIINQAATKLEAAGHKIVYIKDHPKYGVAYKASAAQFGITDHIDGVKSGLDYIEDGKEPVVNCLKNCIYEAEPLDTVTKIYLNRKIQDETSVGWYKVFDENGLDVLLSPGNCSSAPLHDTYGISPYTEMWNFVDFPACVIPFGIVDKEYPDDSHRYPSWLEGIYAKYHPKNYLGGIGSVQLTLPRLQDERLLAIAKVIDLDLK